MPEENSQCRFYEEPEPSCHVEYSIDENEQQETENLTHVKCVDDEALAERGDDDVAWICDLNGPSEEHIQLMISVNENMFDIHHHISAQTAEQLSDMFAAIARAARARSARLAAEREMEERRLAELDARQGDLFKDE